MSATISPENILRELAGLWVDLGRQYQEESATGVLRACTMTLLVLAEESDDAQALGETLAGLMQEHPSRLIVLRVRDGGRRGLESRVFAQCWTSFGERRHICCEQIEITAPAGELPDVPPVLLPLVIPDLPVVLWCRGPRLFGLPAFGGLAAIARKIIVDSAAFPDPAAILRGMAGSGLTLGDLAWTRLTRWRQLIAQIFENRDYAASLPRVSEARIRHVGHPAPVSARYLAAWLADGLSRAGSRAQPVLDPSPDQHAIELSAPGLRVSVRQVEGSCAEVRINEMTSRTPFPVETDRELMREELSIPGRDPVFERTLALAAALALSS